MNTSMSKTRLNNTPKHRRINITLLTALLTTLSLSWPLLSHAQQSQIKSSSTNNEQQEQRPAERWFEIEIILLEQLTDKSRLNEDFTVESSPLQSGKSIDLINSHLQGLLAYQQQLKSCEPDISIKNNAESSPLSAQISAQVSAAAKQIGCNNHQGDLFTDSVAEQIYQIPRRISGHENLYANQPYLLHENSLQLTHIAKSLRRSKSFRPLLHIGWRQAVVDRRSAVPVKLMAGDNLALQRHINLQSQSNEAFNEEMHNDERIRLATDIDKTLLIEQGLTANDTEINSLAMHNEEMINNHIEAIISELTNQDVALEQILSKVKKGDAVPLLENQTQQNDIDEQHANTQPWFISGLFNVHLNHYLFINSQFTVLSEQTNTDNSSTQLLIPFKQNRRVISGELHYFDHPYMGMIVQIRRHERPEPIIDDIEVAEPQTQLTPSN